MTQFPDLSNLTAEARERYTDRVLADPLKYRNVPLRAQHLVKAEATMKLFEVMEDTSLNANEKAARKAEIERESRKPQIAERPEDEDLAIHHREHREFINSLPKDAFHRFVLFATKRNNRRMDEILAEIKAEKAEIQRQRARKRHAA